MRHLYYDGDSYSCTSGNYPTAGHILANKLNAQLHHYGYPAKSPDQTIRTAFRYCIKEMHKDSFMCIGIGVPTRLEKHADISMHETYPNRVFEEDLHSHSVSAHQIDSEILADMLQFDFFETKILINLIMLHDFLMHNGAKFIIHNLSNNYVNDKDYIFSMGIREQIIQRPRIINFYNNSLHDLMDKNNLPGYDYKLFGKNAHPDAKGHAMYADYLLPFIQTYMQ